MEKYDAIRVKKYVHYCAHHALRGKVQEIVLNVHNSSFSVSPSPLSSFSSLLSLGMLLPDSLSIMETTCSDVRRLASL